MSETPMETEEAFEELRKHLIDCDVGCGCTMSAETSIVTALDSIRTALATAEAGRDEAVQYALATDELSMADTQRLLSENQRMKDLLSEVHEAYWGDEELIEPQHLRPDDYHDILGYKLRQALTEQKDNPPAQQESR